MIQYTRPDEPDKFRTNLEKDREALRKAYGRRKKAVGEKKDTKPAIPDRWGDYKAYFSAAQARKCGYCEGKAVVGAHGDVEHYRPKRAISILVNEGRELDHLGNVSGRTGDDLGVGYWWLAYDWNNYLLSCGNCNQKWKKTFFPVSDIPRTVPPVRGAAERVLLLNPFERKDPVNHLEFFANGEVEGRTPEGRATVKICGLNRPSLIDAREEKCESADTAVQQLSAALSAQDSEEEVAALFTLHRLGRRKYVYSGVARSMTKYRAGMTWREVERRLAQELVDTLGAAGGGRRKVAIKNLLKRIAYFDEPDLVRDCLVAEPDTTVEGLAAEVGDPVPEL